MARLSVRVLILSSDRYSDLWKPCLSLMDRHWPDRPWPRSILSGRVSADLPDCEVIQTGYDRGWGLSVALACNVVAEDAVLAVCEDYFAVRAWSTPGLMDAADFLARSGAGYLRLVPTPVPAGAMRSGIYRSHDPGQSYRFSLMPLLVRTGYLAEQAVSWPTPWLFENGCGGDEMVEHWSVEHGGDTPLHITGAARTVPAGGGRSRRIEPEAIKLCEEAGVRCPDPL